MNTQVMFSSNTDLWSTPQSFFDKLNDEFHFTLDPCATHDNHNNVKSITQKKMMDFQKVGIRKQFFAIPPMVEK